jgi:ABC-type multidrug transport system permease subunit
MSVVWVLVKKELRVLLRDRMAGALLLVMPLVFILILGLLLGEGFGQRPDDRLRISLVDLDTGVAPGKRAAFAANTCTLAAQAYGQSVTATGPLPYVLTQAALMIASDVGVSLAPGEPWSHVVERDLAETGGIRVERIESLEEAEQLIHNHRRPAVLVFKPGFTDKVSQCSFLSEGINPFFRDGVYLQQIDAELLIDDKQPGASAIIKQVAQVSLLRVILPWMIGRAFDKLSDASFLSVLAHEAEIPAFLLTEQFKEKMGKGIKIALQKLFSKYNLTGKTWADLTKAKGRRAGEGGEITEYVNRDGSGVLARGAQRYQTLVPSYTVMFSFVLVAIVGYVFVGERRQGTLRRLRAAPIARWQLLLGKLIPCFVVSVGQGLFLLVAGRLLFGMRWGPADWPLWEQFAWLLPVVLCTSLAAMGMAMLVAALARTEMQVALYAVVPILVLSLVGGCLLPREMMPEQTQVLTLATPQGWALEAYGELLMNAGAHYMPNPTIVFEGCGVLAGIGLFCLGLAWASLRLE